MGKTDPIGDTDPTVEFSAKIKNIYVELHNYSFFHGPSEIGNVDERFIGRTAIANRLETILANHETKSGAYLITGYRGVGKSSLVAKVLSDISSGYARSHRTSRYIRIFALFFPFILINLSEGWIRFPAIAFFALAAAFLVSYLYRTDPRRNDLKLSPVSISWSSRILRAFLMEGGRSPNLRFRIFIQDLFLFSILQLIALFCLLHEHTLVGRLWVYFILFLLLAFATTVSTRYKRFALTRDGRQSIWWRVGAYYLHSLSNYINYSHRVYIKINLGQDDLKEIEILRLIATNIYTKYQAFKGVRFANVIWMALRALLLFLSVGTIYFFQPVYHLNQGLTAESQLYRYFPTQGSFMLRNGTGSLDEILQGMESKRFDLEIFD